VKGFDVSLFQSAYDELRARGVVLKQGPGEYRLNYPNGTAATEYITDDLQDALRYGREMATKTPHAAPLPLGPTGGNARSRRGLMYRHNRMIAARRKN